MIKRIELVNFMSHPHTVIEPAEGLTVLVGPNNCGKSAVVAALQILTHNDSSTYVLRHEEKECSVTVETGNGDVITWSRGKNKSPRYTLNGKEFDRLNRAAPAEIQQALQIKKVQCETDSFDVHFGEQKKPVFLLNDSPRAAAEFFASSSDTIRLVEMQALHRQKIRSQNSDRKRCLVEQGQLETTIEALSPLDEVLDQLANAENDFVQLEEHRKWAVGLGELLLRLNMHESELQFLQKRGQVINSLPSFPDFASTDHVTATIEELENRSRQLGVLQRIEESLEPLKPVPEFRVTKTLAELVEQIESTTCAHRALETTSKKLKALAPPPEWKDQRELKGLISSFDSLLTNQKVLDKRLAQTEKDISQMDQEVKTWVEQHPNCPTCGGKVNAHDLFSNVGGGHLHG